MKSTLYVMKNLNTRINQLEEKISRLEELADSVNHELDGLPKENFVTSRVERLATSIVDCRNELSTLKTIQITCRIELCEWLNDEILDDDVCRVMVYRYAFLKTFEEIAQELHYSPSTVFRLHRLGLLHLDLNSTH